MIPRVCSETAVAAAIFSVLPSPSSDIAGEENSPAAAEGSLADTARGRASVSGSDNEHDGRIGRSPLWLVSAVVFRRLKRPVEKDLEEDETAGACEPPGRKLGFPGKCRFADRRSTSLVKIPVGGRGNINCDDVKILTRVIIIFSVNQANDYKPF